MRRAARFIGGRSTKPGAASAKAFRPARWPPAALDTWSSTEATRHGKVSIRLSATISWRHEISRCLARFKARSRYFSLGHLLDFHVSGRRQRLVPIAPFAAQGVNAITAAEKNQPVESEFAECIVKRAHSSGGITQGAHSRSSTWAPARSEPLAGFGELNSRRWSPQWCGPC